MFPNLLIIGAPKCGTTSLHFYLDQHPEISMSAKKELRYFVRPDWRERRDWYEQQFEGFDTPVRGEATPRYARYPTWDGVPERAHSLVPDARLIYVVGDPLERIRSHWAQQWSNGDRRTLDDALRGYERLDNPIVAPSRYATQLEQWLAWFPGEQILVIDQDELRRERRAVLREAFAFLGVDAAFDSPRFADERNTRSEKYALTRVGQPLWNRVLGPAVRRLPERMQDPVRRRTIRALSRKMETPHIDAETRARLESLLRDEADRLRAMTGKPFASWAV
jgi:sulfotransferase family protein